MLRKLFKGGNIQRRKLYEEIRYIKRVQALFVSKAAHPPCQMPYAIFVVVKTILEKSERGGLIIFYLILKESFQIGFLSAASEFRLEHFEYMNLLDLSLKVITPILADNAKSVVTVAFTTASRVEQNEGRTVHTTFGRNNMHRIVSMVLYLKNLKKKNSRKRKCNQGAV